MSKFLKIAFDGGETHCRRADGGYCRYFRQNMLNQACWLFPDGPDSKGTAHSILLKTVKDGTPLRLPMCLAAEKAMEGGKE